MLGKNIQSLDAIQTYFQLGLLNVALIIILLKQIGFIYALISLTFIFVLVSMVNHHLIHRGDFQKGQQFMVIFNDSLSQKVRRIKTDFAQKLNQTESQHENKKRNYFLVVIFFLLDQMLVVVYFCLTFVYDWMEAFIFLNFVYVYFFMPQIFSRASSLVKALLNGSCPFISQKKL